MRHILNATVAIRQKFQDAGRFPYVCIEDYVLRNGREYLSQELTKEEREIVEDAIKSARIEFEARQCFYNSQIMTICDRSLKLIYVEGYCQTTFFPFNHGWVEINEKVIDMTLRHKFEPDADPIIGTFSNRSYFGMPFPRSIVKDRVFMRGEGGSFMDDMGNGYPLLTGAIEIDHKNLVVVKGEYEPRKKPKARKSKRKTDEV